MTIHKALSYFKDIRANYIHKSEVRSGKEMKKEKKLDFLPKPSSVGLMLVLLGNYSRMYSVLTLSVSRDVVRGIACVKVDRCVRR